MKSNSIIIVINFIKFVCFIFYGSESRSRLKWTHDNIMDDTRFQTLYYYNVKLYILYNSS